MKPNTLTFDCYGTLIDWKRGIVDNFRRFSRSGDSNDLDIFNMYVELESKNENDYSTYRQILSTTFLALAHQLKLNPTEEEAEKFADSISEWPAFEDTVSTLKILGENGFKRIILSNIDRSLLIGTIERSKMQVDGFITAEDVKSYKPQTGHWQELLKKYHLQREQVIHIAGSIYHDIIPASNMGFETIWVNRYKESPRDGVYPTHIVQSLSEILKIL